jgi:hypothetical protein
VCSILFLWLCFSWLSLGLFQHFWAWTSHWASPKCILRYNHGQSCICDPYSDNSLSPLPPSCLIYLILFSRLRVVHQKHLWLALDQVQSKKSMIHWRYLTLISLFYFSFIFPFIMCYGYLYVWH